MIATGKADHCSLARDALRQGERCFDGGRTRWSNGLDDHVELAWLKNQVMNRREKAPLVCSERVEAVEELSLSQVLDGNFNEHWVVMTIRERTGTGKEVEVVDPMLIGNRLTARGGKHRWPATAVVADSGL